MAQAIPITIVLTEISCGCCGGVYAINETYRGRAQEHGDSWTCPYCKVGWGYSGKGTLAAKEKELAAERERHQRTIARLNEQEQMRLKAERKLMRVHKGVCPSCNRSFADLARHMACKHNKKPIMRIGAKDLP